MQVQCLSSNGIVTPAIARTAWRCNGASSACSSSPGIRAPSLALALPVFCASSNRLRQLGFNKFLTDKRQVALKATDEDEDDFVYDGMSDDDYGDLDDDYDGQTGINDLHDYGSGFEAAARGGGGGYYQDERERNVADFILEDLDDPEKLRKRVEDRIRAKQHIMMQPQSGSADPMVVSFRNFHYSDSYIWMEFASCPTNKELELVLTTLRSWYILGQLGSFNSQNLQLSRISTERKPDYDSVQAAEKLQPGFYNIGDLELQDNIARLWVDIGPPDPLVLDILINSLQNLNAESIGIKNLVFGGDSWGSWNESLVSRKHGHKIFEI